MRSGSVPKVSVALVRARRPAALPLLNSSAASLLRQLSKTAATNGSSALFIDVDLLLEVSLTALVRCRRRHHQEMAILGSVQSTEGREPLTDTDTRLADDKECGVGQLFYSMSTYAGRWELSRVHRKCLVYTSST